MKKSFLPCCLVVIFAGLFQPGLADDIRFNVGIETGEALFPRIDMNSSGAAAICWYQYDFTAELGRVLLLYATKKGRPEIAIFSPVDPGWDGSQVSPDVAINENGHFIVVWDENSEESDALYARMYYQNKSPKADPFPIYQSQAGEKTSWPRIGMSRSGDFTVCWQSKREGFSKEIFACFFNRDGSAKGVPFQVNSDTTGSQEYPWVDVNPAGRGVVVWRDDRSGLCEVYAQCYDTNGNAVGANLEISRHPGQTEDVGAYSIAVQENGDFAIVWQYPEMAETPHIYFSLFDPEGRPKTEMRIVDPSAEIDSRQPDVFCGPHGGYIVTWTRGYAISHVATYVIHARDYDAAGNALGDVYRVGEEVAYQYDPCGACDAEGNKVFLWDDTRGWVRRNIYGRTLLARKPHLVSVGTGFQGLIPISWTLPYGTDENIPYRIHRTTDSGGTFELLSEVDVSSRPYPRLMLDFTDTSADPGREYYYQVEAVSAGSGGPSDILHGSATLSGHRLHSKWMLRQPSLDGEIQADEWTEAATIDIGNPNAYDPVRLYVKNSRDTLYVAVKDENDDRIELLNCLGMMVDGNKNNRWDADPQEGAFRIFQSGIYFTAYTGRYPDTFHFAVPVVSTDVRGVASLCGRQVHYEAALPLTDPVLTAEPGDTLSIAFWIEDPGSDYGLFYGNSGEWPPNALWEATETLGQVILAGPPPEPPDSSQMFNWAMNSKTREQDSWARYETSVRPPFAYQFTYGDFWASRLAFYGDRLYATTFDTLEENPAFVYSFDYSSQAQAWRFEFPGAQGDAVMMPAVNDSLLFCSAFNIDGLYALDRRTGTQAWFKDIPALFPVIDENRLYLFTDSLYCLDIRDGSKIWTDYIFSRIYGT
ncbi:PQQ-binding-like beta-propeller repeat protein, partial [bacterium]|nr:PQQ-binding-like beta-propeller repeat protein [bacterium]